MDKKIEKKYKPLKANVTVDLKLLFREQSIAGRENAQKEYKNKEDTE